MVSLDYEAIENWLCDCFCCQYDPNHYYSVTKVHPIGDFDILDFFGNDRNYSGKKGAIQEHCNKDNEDWS